MGGSEMDEHFKRPKDTQAWIIQVWVSFLLAVSAMEVISRESSFEITQH